MAGLSQRYDAIVVTEQLIEHTKMDVGAAAAVPVAASSA
jgi:hypothetical protein